METNTETALSVFHTRRLLQVIELPLENSDETNVILSFASRCTEKKQFQSFYCADKTLLLRSLEEDLHPRFWRLPWTLALERIQQSSQLTGFNLNIPSLERQTSNGSTNMTQQVIALEFSPEGDWLAVVVSWGIKIFMLVIPVASLVTRERKMALQRHLRDGAPGDLMSVEPSCMSTQMMSYLRAHGQNGAKYNSTVAGDAEDMSTLEFAQGMTSPTCVNWWRSFNGQNYLLVGSTNDLISIVHVETNKESCRCELSGKILSIELVHNTTTTAMLVKTRRQNDISFFKVLLEMKKGDDVKTFPEHFLEDKEFRPQRIKRFSSSSSIHVIQEDSRITSHLLVHEGTTISFYSNDFTWKLLGSCALPTALITSIQSLQIQFCSSQLLLLQATNESTNIATWLSYRLKDQEIHESKIVHTLKLREDECIRRVVPGISLDNEPEMLYFLHTDHQVYECRPRWSRITLFQALHARSMHVQDAVFIGYAMGIDMASLCEVVADTICAEHQPPNKPMSRNSCEWIMRLYAKSRVLPSKAMEKLVSHGGLVNAIEYAKETLEKPDVVSDRQILAHTLLESALKLYLTEPSVANWEWLGDFLGTNQDYDAPFGIQECSKAMAIDSTLRIGHHRQEMNMALASLQSFGLRLLPKHVDFLVKEGYAANLTAPEARILFRTIPQSQQLETMMAHPSSLLLQRDWILRILPDLSDYLTLKLATALDPRCVCDRPLQSMTLPYYVPLSDVATSEAIVVTMEEKVELFMTVLLRLNSPRCHLKEIVAKGYTEGDMLSLIQLWSKQYRPPVMVLRCAEYANWTAAAAYYEAQGEWVDAIECKLHLHALQSPNQDQPIIRHEDLVHLMESLVFSTNSMDNSMRVAVLARLFIHWHAMKYSLEALEAFLLKQSDLSLVSEILFTSPELGSFHERDVEWIIQCQHLNFSGSFYFHVCQRHFQDAQNPLDDTIPQLVSNVLENLKRHHNEPAHIKIHRQTARAFGQNDPIETHSKLFSCGHVFSKRIFEDDIVPLFEKKMIEFPGIPKTSKLILEEYTKGSKRMETPCPVCTFSRIQTIFAQQNGRKSTREPPRPRIMTSDQWIWK